MRIENSFIPAQGVGETTERRIWREGVTHWDDFDEGLVGTKTGRNISQFIDAARERLEAGDADFFGQTLDHRYLWRTYDNFREGACFFDIETTGLDHYRNDVTTVSVYRAGETRTYVQGDDLTAENLQAEFDEASLVISFNGKRFDAPFLAADLGVEVERPHIDLLYSCRRLNLTGGLKAIEKELGMERELPDVDGREAVRLWHQFQGGDGDALETLIAYNQEDAVNLEFLMDEVHDQLAESVFRQHCQN